MALEQQPPQNPSEQVPATPETPPAEAPVVEARIPAAQGPASPRELKPEDFAMLSRLPTRKPETFDRDAITRAAWMVGGLAIGLWVISMFAKPKAPPEEIPAPPPAAVQEAAPIVLPGNDPVPAPQVESLTPEPAFQPVTPAPIQQAPAAQPVQPAQPVEQAPAAPDPSLFDEAPAETYEPLRETVPAPADTPDPSNLFPKN